MPKAGVAHGLGAPQLHLGRILREFAIEYGFKELYGDVMEAYNQNY